VDRKYWEKKGSNYDAEIFDVYAEDQMGVVASTIRQLVQKNHQVADLGCGTGKALPLLSGRARSVEAVDLSGSCLEKARDVCAGLPGITYRRADLSRDRQRGLLDFVLNVNVLIMPDETVRKAILRTIARRLKRGGKCLLVVPSLESSLWVARQLYVWERRDGVAAPAARRAVIQLLGDRFGPSLAEGVVPIDGVATKHYLGPEIERDLGEVGIRVLKMERVNYGWHTEFSDPPRWMREPYPWDWLVVGQR
jgi:SAM-dependent methyltransferase